MLCAVCLEQKIKIAKLPSELSLGNLKSWNIYHIAYSTSNIPPKHISMQNMYMNIHNIIHKKFEENPIIHLVNKSINKMWYIHTIKRNEVLTHDTTWINPENSQWKKPIAKDHILYNSIHTKCSRKSKSIETENRFRLLRVRFGQQMGHDYKWVWSFFLRERYMKLLFEGMKML